MDIQDAVASQIEDKVLYAEKKRRETSHVKTRQDQTWMRMRFETQGRKRVDATKLDWIRGDSHPHSMIL